MSDELFKIEFSDWCLWKDRNSLDNIKHPGIYILAKFKPDLLRKIDLNDKSIIYIGETCNSLRRRFGQFNRSAFKNSRGHSGGVSYRGKYKDDKGEDLYVSIFPVLNINDNIKHLYIRYVERKLILDYALKNGNQPVLNKK